MATGGQNARNFDKRKPVLPIFVRSNEIPPGDYMTTWEMCTAAESVSGKDTILGAQEIRSLWRIYPLTMDARQTLIIQGFAVRGVSLTVYRENPFQIKDDGIERPVTKVWIGNVPISCADDEITNALVKIGCELRSDMKHECARNPSNGLTRFLTGRRFIFISLPDKPLEKSLRVNHLFTASVYHKEQPKEARRVTCHNCLSEGHTKNECTRPVVCRQCKKEGHVRGDPDCEAVLVQRQSPFTYASAAATPTLSLPLPSPPPSPTVIPETQLSMEEFPPPPPPPSQSSSDVIPPTQVMAPPSSGARPKEQVRGRTTVKKSRDKKQVSIDRAVNIMRSRSTSSHRSQSLKRNLDDSDSRQGPSKTSKTKDSVDASEATSVFNDDDWPSDNFTTDSHF